MKAFLLQMILIVRNAQGCSRLRIGDGSAQRLGCEHSAGRPYLPIERELEHKKHKRHKRLHPGKFLVLLVPLVFRSWHSPRYCRLCGSRWARLGGVMRMTKVFGLLGMVLSVVVVAAQ